MKTVALYSVFESVISKIRCFFMRFRSRGVIDFETLVNTSLKGSTFRPSEVLGAFELIKEGAIDFMALGFRVDIGNDFISIWPNIIGSVKDTVDPSTGKVIPADPSKLTAADGETKVGCTVAKKYNKKVSKIIEWKKIKESDKPEDLVDDTEDPNDNPETIPTIDTSTGSNNSGGDDIPSGNG